jgi:putative phosphoribosyl transferase
MDRSMEEHERGASSPVPEHEVLIPASENIRLAGTLSIPAGPHGAVLFAHGSGSSRYSPRNRSVADFLQSHRLATLLFDLLTPDEEEAERWTRLLRFDIELLAERLAAATDWILRDSRTRSLPIGYFGASTGAAAALVAAARMGEQIGAIVSRGGRPDLAGDHLRDVRSPTLLIVGGDDEPVIELNLDALRMLRCKKRLEIVPRASHLFEEPGTLEKVAELAASWFVEHLAGRGRRSAVENSAWPP